MQNDITIITDAGAAVLIDAMINGRQIQLNRFHIGANFGYVPSRTQTDILDPQNVLCDETAVETNPPAGQPPQSEANAIYMTRTGPNSLTITLQLFPFVGTWSYGEYVIFTNDGIPFLIGVYAQPRLKTATDQSKLGNLATIDSHIVLADTGSTVDITIGHETWHSLMVVDNETQLPAVSQDCPNTFVIRDYKNSGTTAIANKDTVANEWKFIFTPSFAPPTPGPDPDPDNPSSTDLNKNIVSDNQGQVATTYQAANRIPLLDRFFNIVCGGNTDLDRTSPGHALDIKVYKDNADFMSAYIGLSFNNIIWNNNNDKLTFTLATTTTTWQQIYDLKQHLMLNIVATTSLPAPFDQIIGLREITPTRLTNAIEIYVPGVDAWWPSLQSSIAYTASNDIIFSTKPSFKPYNGKSLYDAGLPLDNGATSLVRQDINNSPSYKLRIEGYANYCDEQNTITNWDPTETYSIGKMVFRDRNLFILLQNTSINEDPLLYPQIWNNSSTSDQILWPEVQIYNQNSLQLNPLIQNSVGATTSSYGRVIFYGADLNNPNRTQALPFLRKTINPYLTWQVGLDGNCIASTDVTAALNWANSEPAMTAQDTPTSKHAYSYQTVENTDMWFNGNLPWKASDLNVATMFTTRSYMPFNNCVLVNNSRGLIFRSVTIHFRNTTGSSSVAEWVQYWDQTNLPYDPPPEWTFLTTQERDLYFNTDPTGIEALNAPGACLDNPELDWDDEDVLDLVVFCKVAGVAYLWMKQYKETQRPTYVNVYGLNVNVDQLATPSANGEISNIYDDNIFPKILIGTFAVTGPTLVLNSSNSTISETTNFNYIMVDFVAPQEWTDTTNRATSISNARALYEANIQKLIPASQDYDPYILIKNKRYQAMTQEFGYLPSTNTLPIYFIEPHFWFQDQQNVIDFFISHPTFFYQGIKIALRENEPSYNNSICTELHRIETHDFEFSKDYQDQYVIGDSMAIDYGMFNPPLTDATAPNVVGKMLKNTLNRSYVEALGIVQVSVVESTLQITITTPPFNVGDLILGQLSGVQGTITSLVTTDELVVQSDSPFLSGEDISSSSGGYATIISETNTAFLVNQIGGRLLAWDDGFIYRSMLSVSDVALHGNGVPEIFAWIPTDQVFDIMEHADHWTSVVQTTRLNASFWQYKPDIFLGVMPAGGILPSGGTIYTYTTSSGQIANTYYWDVYNGAYLPIKPEHVFYNDGERDAYFYTHPTEMDEDILNKNSGTRLLQRYLPNQHLIVKQFATEADKNTYFGNYLHSQEGIDIANSGQYIEVASNWYIMGYSPLNLFSQVFDTETIAKSFFAANPSYYQNNLIVKVNENGGRYLVINSVTIVPQQQFNTYQDMIDYGTYNGATIPAGYIVRVISDPDTSKNEYYEWDSGMLTWQVIAQSQFWQWNNYVVSFTYTLLPTIPKSWQDVLVHDNTFLTDQMNFQTEQQRTNFFIANPSRLNPNQLFYCPLSSLSGVNYVYTSHVLIDFTLLNVFQRQTSVAEIVFEQRNVIAGSSILKEGVYYAFACLNVPTVSKPQSLMDMFLSMDGSGNALVNSGIFQGNFSHYVRIGRFHTNNQNQFIDGFGGVGGLYSPNDFRSCMSPMQAEPFYGREPNAFSSILDVQWQFPNKLFEQWIPNTWHFDQIIYGTAYRALWGDIAEYYKSDKPYPAGTVVQFGGDAEITIATTEACSVISDETKAAFLISNKNSNEIGYLPVVLSGKVEVLLDGYAQKHQKLYLSKNKPGTASTVPNGNVLGRAIADCRDGKVLAIIKLAL